MSSSLPRQRGKGSLSWKFSGDNALKIHRWTFTDVVFVFPCEGAHSLQASPPPPLGPHRISELAGSRAPGVVHRSSPPRRWSCLVGNDLSIGTACVGRDERKKDPFSITAVRWILFFRRRGPCLPQIIALHPCLLLIDTWERERERREESPAEPAEIKTRVSGRPKWRMRQMPAECRWDKLTDCRICLQAA